MTGLFVRLYLDEDVSILIKQLLMSQGYDVVTTVEAGNRQKPDREQLAYAANERSNRYTQSWRFREVGE